MAEIFDPYYRWLGIRDSQRPLNHYRLLGLELFEGEPEVISHAADRQMAHIRTLAVGDNIDASQRLLNELAAAKICLLNATQKAEYDDGLRARLKPPEPAGRAIAPWRGTKGGADSPSAPASRAPQEAPSILSDVPVQPLLPLIVETGLSGPTTLRRFPIRSFRPRRRRKSRFRIVVVVTVAAIVVVLAGWLFNGGLHRVRQQLAKLQPSQIATESGTTRLPSVDSLKATDAAGKSAPLPAGPPMAASQEVGQPSSDEGPLPANDDSGKTTTPVAASPSPPMPLIAPFGPDEALNSQASWAGHLGRDVVETNSIGMPLVLIPPGEFTMGSPDSEADRDSVGVAHNVRLTKPFFLGLYEVTRAEYQRVMGTDPGGVSGTGPSEPPQAGDGTESLPISMVLFDEAAEFCRLLSQLPDEQRSGRTYRLPTEAEWEFACRAGSVTAYHFGDSLPAECANAGWKLNLPANVGSFSPNGFGLFDMHGNVWEWCNDWYEEYHGDATDPQGPASNPEFRRVLRGGSFAVEVRFCRSATRNCDPQSIRRGDGGFRVVCEFDSRGSHQITSADGDPGKSIAKPPAAKSPFSASEARNLQARWATYLNAPVVETNSIGMKMVLIPPGEFDMGTDKEEYPEITQHGASAMGEYWFREYPRHRVRLTRPFQIGACEVTVGQFRHFVDATGFKTEVERRPSPIATTWSRNESVELDEKRPVGMVTWEDSIAFCEWLSNQEGRKYDLTTEAQWEYSCRAGTAGHWGSVDAPGVELDSQAWRQSKNQGAQAVGGKLPNAFGIYDMLGNLHERCRDRFREYAEELAVDPLGTIDDNVRMLRGGAWNSGPFMVRPAFRYWDLPPVLASADIGFRVVCDVEDGTGSPTAPGPRP